VILSLEAGDAEFEGQLNLSPPEQYESASHVKHPPAPYPWNLSLHIHAEISILASKESEFAAQSVQVSTRDPSNLE
jgi:hypothetical protein